MRQLIQKFSDCFVNRRDAYYKQWADTNTKGFGYTAVYAPLTPDLIYFHMCEFITLGLCNLDANGYGRWLCFDSDIADGQLDTLERWLRQHGWHCIREGKRPGRDGHLWVLFDVPIPGEQLQIIAKRMMKLAEVEIEEVFPKQHKPNKLGNQVKAPLGKHLKPGADGAIGWFEDCPEKTIKVQLEWLAQQPLNSATAAIKLAHANRPMPKPINLKRHDYSGHKIDFLKYANEQCLQLDGKYYRGACPACLANGHDTDNNHLWINVESGYVGCWRCGKEGFKNIVMAIKQGTKIGAA